MNPIIFLDIDGVLNSQSYYESDRYKEKETDNRFDYDLEEIDERAVSYLSDLIKETNADIVVSSTWRNRYSVEEFQKLLEAKGLVGKVIGKTPRCGEDCIRGNEILKWMKTNIKDYSDFNCYVILDDDSDMLYWQRNNLIVVDGSVGLTSTLCYRAKRILKSFNLN